MWGVTTYMCMGVTVLCVLIMCEVTISTLFVVVFCFGCYLFVVVLLLLFVWGAPLVLIILLTSLHRDLSWSH